MRYAGSGGVEFDAVPSQTELRDRWAESVEMKNARIVPALD